MAQAQKTVLALTREKFRTHAQPMVVVINGKEYQVPRKEFSTGSLGWYLNDKIDITIDGVPAKVQIGLNLTLVGSKELPGAPAPEAAPAAAPSEPAAATAPPAPGGTNEKGEVEF